jgi:hypothetical protein
VLFRSNLTTIATWTFYECTSLSSVSIPTGVTTLAWGAFSACTSLTNVAIPEGMTSLGNDAFSGCTQLTSVRIPNSVTSLGDTAFANCAWLTGLYFQGNAPTLGGDNVFSSDSAIAYYLPGTIGWTPQIQTGADTFGIRTNQFGFTITGTSGLGTVVQACTNLANPTWKPVATNVLAFGSSYFSDPQWTNYPARFYHLANTTYGGLPLQPFAASTN